MKPFNLKEALAGKPVVTRDGREVTQLAFFPGVSEYPVVAYSGDKETDSYTAQGHFVKGGERRRDLFMASTEKTVWVNLYRNEFLSTKNGDNIAVGVNTFDSEEDAENGHGEGYVGTAKVSWEE